MVQIIPESTGWTLFSNIETDNKGDKSPTAKATSLFEVNIYASLSLKNKKNMNRRNPMANDVSTDTIIENFAALALPLPSSFATRTLQNKVRRWSFQGKLTTEEKENKMEGWDWWKNQWNYLAAAMKPSDIIISHPLMLRL